MVEDEQPSLSVTGELCGADVVVAECCLEAAWRRSISAVQRADVHAGIRDPLDERSHERGLPDSRDPVDVDHCLRPRADDGVQGRKLIFTTHEGAGPQLEIGCHRDDS